MTYLVWRQHRNQLLFATLALGALAVVLIPSGVHLASAYGTARQSCRASGSCGDLSNSLFRNYGILFDVVGLTAVIPALFGMFWGAPLVAAEMETGTHQLAWTQTVTRRRWLGVKVGWLLAAAALWGGAMTTLVTWWSGPVNSVNQSRFNLGHFDTQGLVPIGYSVFAVALGITAGLLLRRVLPALAVTLGAFAGLRFAIDYALRPRYLAPLTRIYPIGGQARLTGSYWTIGTQVIDPSGKVSGGLHLTPQTVPAACRGLFGVRPGITQCLGAHGWRVLATYQPADRFWTFQVIELGIYLALAAALLAASFALIPRGDA